MVICPDTRIDEAYQCAERLRLNVAALKFKDQEAGIRLTISIGVAEKKEGVASVEELLSRADECLYAAKQGGRNRTVVKK